MSKERKNWIRGVWDNEPDQVKWEHAGLDCMIQRVQYLGTLCGYVRVPEGHPAYEKDYHDVAVSVHGGLTFSDEINGDKWWVGFDCAHSGDLTPGVTVFKGDVYRDVAYVKAEVESLADQLAAMGGER